MDRASLDVLYAERVVSDRGCSYYVRPDCEEDVMSPEIQSGAPQPADQDWVFLFSGADALTPLQSGPQALWTVAEARSLFADLGPLILTGTWEQRPAWACQVMSHAWDPMRAAAGSLYTLLGRVQDPLFATYGRALQLLNWRQDHQFCGRCGTPTELIDDDRGLNCSVCAHAVYPRLSPCAIVLVTRGEEMLLASAVGSGGRFYSTLAGFVEPGERVEDTVHREVFEEVGIRVSNLQYFDSQPWPFPGQLMLGFHATWHEGDIRIDPNEIEHADWFTKDHMPPIPPLTSIAGRLIHSFLSRH